MRWSLLVSATSVDVKYVQATVRSVDRRHHLSGATVWENNAVRASKSVYVYIPEGSSYTVTLYPGTVRPKTNRVTMGLHLNAQRGPYEPWACGDVDAWPMNTLKQR